MNPPPEGLDLAPLEDRVERALASGDESGLRVLGYGEISCVLAHSVAGTEYACKRLPVFPDGGILDAYQGTLDAYLAALTKGGIHPVPTRLVRVGRPDGRVAAYLVQPILDPRCLGPKFAAEASAGEVATLVRDIAERVASCVNPGLGLDGQLSNWARVDGKLYYLDVSTPMLRDEAGLERLDTGLFLASLPALLRPIVRRFMLRSILDKYYDVRGILLDLAGNLFKERLERLLPAFVEGFGPRVPRAITPDEAQRYYRDDAGTWALLQRLRRIDRWWQRNVRRKVYPFLLPGRIER